MSNLCDDIHELRCLACFVNKTNYGKKYGKELIHLVIDFDEYSLYSRCNSCFLCSRKLWLAIVELLLLANRRVPNRTLALGESLAVATVGRSENCIQDQAVMSFSVFRHTVNASSRCQITGRSWAHDDEV